MRRFASLALVMLFVAGCGGSEGSSSADDRSKRHTVGFINLRRDTDISELLAWLRDHRIRPTQLIREYRVGDETNTTFFMVREGSGDAEIADRYRRETKTSLDGTEVPAAFPGATAETLNSQREALAEAKRQAKQGPALVTRLEVSGPVDVLHSLADDPLVAQVFVKP